MSELTGSNHRCRAQFKCVQTVVGWRFAGIGPKGLSYYYYKASLKLLLKVDLSVCPESYYYYYYAYYYYYY